MTSCGAGFNEGSATEEKSVADLPGDPFYAFLYRLADQLEPEVQAVFTAAVEQLHANLSEADLLQAIESGSVAVVEGALMWPTFEESFGKVGDALATVAKSVAEHMAPGLQELGAAVDVSSLQARALAYASRHTAELVTSVTNESRFAIRELVEQGFMEDRGAAQIARSLRSVLGLNARQAQAFDRFMSDLIDGERVGPDGNPYSPAQIQRLIDQEHEAQVNYRADTIARTETWDVGNAAQIEAWQDAAAGGASIHGLGTHFTSSSGEVIVRPPRHTCCHCGQQLMRKDGPDGRVYYVRRWVTSPGACEICRRLEGVTAGS